MLLIISMGAGKERVFMEKTMIGNMTAAEENENSYQSKLAGQKAVLKKAIKELLDPTAGMSEEESKEYEMRIIAKLKSGKKLTAKEMDYLKIHNPKLYITAMRVQRAREFLQTSLKKCKSKEEVNTVISMTLGGISDKDPDKEYIVAGLRDVIQKFKKSREYARLPETNKEVDKKKKKNTGAAIHARDDEDDEDVMITPIQELLDELPTFDVMQ